MIKIIQPQKNESSSQRTVAHETVANRMYTHEIIANIVDNKTKLVKKPLIALLMK